MASLSGQWISKTFKQLLQIGSNNTGITSSLQTVQDGAGNNTVLQLSTTAVNINAASISINGNTLTISSNTSIAGNLTGGGTVATGGYVLTVSSTASVSGTNTGDQTLSDATISTTDITTNNVSTSKHGFCPKLPNNAGVWLDGTGNFTTPTGTGGTVTSVTFTGDGTVLSSTPSSAVTTSGTLTASLNTQTANKVFAGPTTGSAANPTFRSLVAADLPITVNSGTSGQMAYYSASSATISGNANVTISTATMTLGVNASATGALALANGGGSGQSVTLNNPSCTSAYTFSFPTTVGTSGYALTSSGSSGTANTWTAIPAAVSDATITTTDVTTNNVSSTKHGWMPKIETAAGNAATGAIGEVISTSKTNAGGVSVSNNTVTDIMSISLTAGDWDVSGICSTNFGGTPLFAWAWISLTSATQPDSSLQTAAAGNVNSNLIGLCVAPLRVNVNTTTTVYMTALVQFATSTATCSGKLYARRVR